MHKYYFEHGHNNILRFLPGKIKMENYWVEPAQFVLGKTVYRRNPTLADLFSKIKYGEKMGTGFERIKEKCKKENAPFPEIEYNQNYFYITFKQSKEYLKATLGSQKTAETKEKSSEKTREKTREKIIRLISEDPTITTEELAQKTELTIKGIEWNLRKLKQKNLLRRLGPDKGGKWEVRK